MDKESTKQRILDASDDDPTIHAIYHTGSDEGLDYLLVLATKTHDGMEMLKLRYFALHPSNPEEDTWMQNGITARSSDKLMASLAKDFAAVANGKPDEATIGRDLTDETPE